MVLALAALCRPALLLWTLAAWRRALVASLPRIKGDSPIFTQTKIGTVPDSRGPTARGGIVKTFRPAAAFALGAILVLGPWAIRNELQFGQPIVTTTHGGYTLLLANNPEFYDWLRSGSWGSVWESDRFKYNWACRDPENRVGGQPRTELETDRQAYDEAWQTIRAQPGMFLYACLVRVGRFWSPLPHQLTAGESPRHRLSRYAVGVWYVAEFLLAMFGISRLIKEQGPGARGEGRGRSGPHPSPLPKGEGTCPALTLALSQRERGQIPPSALRPPPSALRPPPSALRPPPSAFRLPPSAFRPSPWLWGFLLVGCLMASHIVYWTDMRMRAPVMPVVALLAAKALCRRDRESDDLN